LFSFRTAVSAGDLSLLIPIPAPAAACREPSGDSVPGCLTASELSGNFGSRTTAPAAWWADRKAGWPF